MSLTIEFKKVNSFYNRYLKRFLDVILGILGIIIFFPIFVTVGILIKLEDKGSIFFKQDRVGQHWKIFKIYKFRTMIENAEKLGGQITEKNDPRITKIGKFLRKYKVDELPQLINVVKGDMSIVGPRPEVPKYAYLFKEDYNIILKVKPGITDYASIKFRNESELLDNCENHEKIYIEKILPEKIKYYKKYINEVSFYTDIKIIFLTLIKIFL